MGFTKLDEGILMSSIMAEDSDTFKIWIAFLAACDYHGIARVSSIYLASICHLALEVVDKAIELLEAPDLRSRSFDEEGRRIKRVDGGWFVVNYKKYREFTYSDSPEAIRQRRHREINRERDGVLHVTKQRDMSASAFASSASVLKKKGKSKEKGMSPNDLRLVQLLIDLMGKNNPTSTTLQNLTPARQATWLRECRLLREKDGKSVEDIEAVIRFSQDDSFWKSNILSMPKLRDKWDQLYLKAKGSDPHAGIKEWLADQEKKDA